MFKKIVPVFGDVTSKRLGLSEEQYQHVVNNANIVFHMAASLKLEATLKPNVLMNLTGTKYVLDMCKEMKKLSSVIHLSTAFCNSDQEVMDEDVYDWTEKPLDIMKCAEWMTEDAMVEMSKAVLGCHPNTYTYTKRLAEIYVRDEFKNLPICIARPSIVTPSLQEPFPGWVDSLNGPIGIMVAGAKGVMRSMLCEAEFHAEVIAVDIAINGLIIIAQKNATLAQK
jgi:alcohol-forming fatty acyl-CoA reductase